jgi:hypothetical protein
VCFYARGLGAWPVESYHIVSSNGAIVMVYLTFWCWWGVRAANEVRLSRSSQHRKISRISFSAVLCRRSGSGVIRYYRAGHVSNTSDKYLAHALSVVQ